MIAVTGANGLVGSFIVKKLIDIGQPVTVIVRASANLELLNGYREKVVVRHADILDVPSLTESLDRVDTVIHSAALVSFNPRRTKKIFVTNVEGTRNVVNACLTLGIPRLIHISSVAALGRVKGVSSIDEESKWVPGPLNTDYAESKYRAELEVYRGMEEGLAVSLINPSVVLAPADWDRSSAQLFRYAWNENYFYPAGSLNYIDVRDLADMIVRIYSSADHGQKFIANAGTILFKDFFEQLAKQLNKRPPSIAVSPRLALVGARLEAIRSMITGNEPLVTRHTARIAGETFRYNSQKAIDRLGMKFTPLQQTLEWCCAQYLGKLTINK